MIYFNNHSIFNYRIIKYEIPEEIVLYHGFTNNITLGDDNLIAYFSPNKKILIISKIDNLSIENINNKFSSGNLGERIDGIGSFFQNMDNKHSKYDINIIFRMFI